jgi:hypothetical protein
LTSFNLNGPWFCPFQEVYSQKKDADRSDNTKKPRVNLLKKYGQNTIHKFSSSQPRSADVYRRFEKQCPPVVNAL